MVARRDNDQTASSSLQRDEEVHDSPAAKIPNESIGVGFYTAEKVNGRLEEDCRACSNNEVETSATPSVFGNLLGKHVFITFPLS